ncbi:hypothetical protein M405DRAFT_867135 [Rhizopogon salebrosus TDB-379]|nr:hypothetical protein M405DRAFT_867135 [Rhizopogon salebrosus TDB-379]
MSKPNTRSGSKSNDSAAPASSTHPPSTKAVVPPRPKPRPSSKASSKVSVGRKRTEEDVVDGGDGEDDRAALTAKIALLERQLKSNANVKAKAAQERLETERQGKELKTCWMQKAMLKKMQKTLTHHCSSQKRLDRVL